MPRYNMPHNPYMDFGIDHKIERQTRGMMAPAQCRCGSIYDTAKVTVTARYADCSVWTAPCCGRVEDDRPWTRGYTPL